MHVKVTALRGVCSYIPPPNAAYLGRGRRRGWFALLCLHLITSAVDGGPVFIVMFGLVWEEGWHGHDSTGGG